MRGLSSRVFSQARFVRTAVSAKDYPRMNDGRGRLLPEVAVIGRSNVGKSTLLNALFQKKGLVKTSSSPGKTQTLNFFAVEGACSFVDVPGYGYAKVPESVQKNWGPMIEEYLHTRESLSLLLFLFDVRRIPNEEDKKLLEWIAHHKIPLLFVLTKVDKLKESELREQQEKIAAAFGDFSFAPIIFSAPKKIGRQELTRGILHHLRPGVAL